MIPEECRNGGCLLYSRDSQQTCGVRCGMWSPDYDGQDDDGLDWLDCFLNSHVVFPV